MYQVRHIKRVCTTEERLREVIDIAHREDYEMVGIETKVLEDCLRILTDTKINLLQTSRG